MINAGSDVTDANDSTFAHIISDFVVEAMLIQSTAMSGKKRRIFRQFYWLTWRKRLKIRAPVALTVAVKTIADMAMRTLH